MPEKELSEGVVNKPNGIDDDDDDCVILQVIKPSGVNDDCVVLDGDPESRVKRDNDTPNETDDELLVVGEKGKIACRDYPHSRHLCGNFPYSSTPHERHCGQCHCYVCDSPAPCLKWGDGLLTTDHCHATDKSKTWKKLREDSKLVKTSPLPDSTNNGTIGDAVNSQHKHILPPNTEQLSSLSVLMNRRSRSTASRPLSARGSRSAISRPHSITQSQENQAFQQILASELLTSGLNNLTPQDQSFEKILENELSSLNSTVNNQVSRSTKTNPLAGNPLPQYQASQPITMDARNALSSLRSRIQNQISMQNNVPAFAMQNNASGFTTASTILNGLNNGISQESGSTLGRNGYPFHTVPSTSLGVQNHAIQKMRGSKVHSLGTMLNGIDSIGALNTMTTNGVTPPDAPSLNNLFNPYGVRYPAAATRLSYRRNGYGQDGAWIANTFNSLLTQPTYSPTFATQLPYQSNNNLQGNAKKSSTPSNGSSHLSFDDVKP